MLRLLSARLVAATLAGLAVGAGAGYALAAAVGAGVPLPAQKAAALQRLASVATTDSNTKPVPAPRLRPRPIPGQMLGPDVPVPVAPSVLQASNGWLAGDGRTLVVVYAGAAGNDSSVGRLVVVRQDLLAGTQTVHTLDTGPTGALTIVTAPLGRSAESSAQTARIEVRAAAGRVLTLDLRTDDISPGAHGSSLPWPAPARPNE